MSYATKRPQQAGNDDDGIHAWASTVDRFPTDTLLRQHGFEIYERRHGQEPKWILRKGPRLFAEHPRDGDLIFRQSEALDKVPKAEREKLAAVEYPPVELGGCDGAK